MMNPLLYLKIFAWISIVALSFSIVSDFWLPMILGAIVITILVRLAAPPKA